MIRNAVLLAPPITSAAASSSTKFAREVRALHPEMIFSRPEADVFVPNGMPPSVALAGPRRWGATPFKFNSHIQARI